MANTYWWYVVFIIDTQQRTIKNVQLDVEIKATYAGYTETACGAGTGYKDSDGDKLYDGEEWYYGTSPDKADTDYDGSWDSTEVWFMKSGANPLFQQRVIRVYIYGYGFGYSGRFYLTVNEIRTPPTGWIEFTGGTSYSPWTEVCVLYPVSSTYAAIQWYVYVDFYSLSVSDLSGVGTSACNLDSNDPFIRIGWGNYGWLWLTYSTPKASPDEPPWAPLARALAPYQIYEDMNQEFPTSIFFDGDRNMANNGLPATWPDGTGNRRWHKDNAINSALANSGYVGKGYYAKSDYEKKVSLTTVYLQGYQQGNLLGIQYWFYYPFHDDPGLDPHPHNWWYFWVVYEMDISARKPVKVVYDFHHNLRAESFTDTGRVQRDGLHVLTYHDAGGHRVLWDSGETPSLGDLLLLSRRWTLADVYEEYPTRDVLGGDKIFGTMIEYLKRKGEIANWRNANQDWNEGATLKVEAFSHWVWVYGVESTLVNDPQ
ncbi:MAG: hypothetical protein ACP5KJ_04210, partial [Candidatus Micrarchaeia archaeon]